MKVIQDFVDKIDEELADAKCYAEKYVYHKAKGSNRASQYKAMASDELNHATINHAFAVEEIETTNKVFSAPAEMQEAWDKAHKGYVEKAAWIKQMLSM